MEEKIEKEFNDEEFMEKEMTTLLNFLKIVC